eukprot:TRINITY_DN13356_c3_g3_i2.p1 TRINITY_DN13356_c3_g3~~TRINITY_DN13356_c3_g3_i2.p1  ORF type:complete len:224 (+),score=22.40 TRINITY_DN13356_c3_g3_i2:41-673(+)
MASDPFALCPVDYSPVKGTDTDEEDAHQLRFPISKLPELPQRNSAYWKEAGIGICVVGTLCVILVSATFGVTSSTETTQMGQVALVSILVEAVLAVLSTSYLLFSNAGVIHRTEKTCYPIPRQVEECLRQSRLLTSFGNVKGPPDSDLHGSYCVRCFVWRPKNAGKVTIVLCASAVSVDLIIIAEYSGDALSGVTCLVSWLILVCLLQAS